MTRRRDGTLAGLQRTAGLAAALAAIGTGAGCARDSGPEVAAAPIAVRLLALGDSYTAGTGIRPHLAWPSQLADSLRAAGDSVATVEVVAAAAWTTGDLLAALAASAPSGPFDLVGLLIGVNNQYRGLDPAVFAGDYGRLLDRAVDLGDGEPGRVIALTIPDYGVTPVGSVFGAERIAREIDALNREIQRQVAARGIVLVDIAPLSRQATDNPALVAGDGLHFSVEMHRRWVGLVLPQVERILMRH